MVENRTNAGTVANRVELRAYIRFQLAQLGAKNGHHEFELLCFELARQRIQSNILPATGPVQAGGDQGRDFESYRSALLQRGETSRFGAAVDEAQVVDTAFACTLDKRVKTKVRSDLEVIFSTGIRPARVVYFLEAAVPVGMRHKLQAIAMEKHSAALDIFDGEAIADMLADPDLFWIAEQFLRVPSELFPLVEIDSEYRLLRRNWIESAGSPSTFADWIEIKRGLRRCTFTDALKPDLGAWMSLARRFVAGDDPYLRQKALYEICVAQLRGRNNLDPEVTTLEAFFDRFPQDPAVSEVEDYAILASYALTAHIVGHFSESFDACLARVESALTIVKAGIEEHKSDLERFILNKCSVHLHQHKLVVEGNVKEAKAMVEGLVRCVSLSERCPICDIDDLVGMVELLVPFIGSAPGFSEMADRLDALVAARRGNAAAAEGCRNRALKFRDGGDLLRAIDQFQRAKEGWFAGETMRGSILATLTLAQCYADLHLNYASRFYAMGAFALALNTADEHDHDLAPRAALLVAETFFVTGNGLRFISALGPALIAQENFQTNPFDLERHPEIARQLAHAANVRLYTEKAVPHLLPLLLRQTEAWPLTAADKDEVYSMVREGRLAPLSAEEIVAKTVAEIGQAFFQEISSRGIIEWRALGITWRVDYERPDEHRAEQVVALLQILQVDLALDDLHILPSDVAITVRSGDGSDMSLHFRPDNACSSWVVEFPRQSADSEDEPAIALAICVEVIGRCTVLPANEFNAIVKQALDRGLKNRAFWVRPVSELMTEARDLAEIIGLPDEVEAPPLPQSSPLEAPQLAWNDQVGRGYSLDTAQKLIGNRYRRLAGFARHYVPILMKNERIKRTMRDLREEGYKDWHLLLILFNACLNLLSPEMRDPRNYRRGLAAANTKRLFEEFQTGDAPMPDAEAVSDELLGFQVRALPSVTMTAWNLALHRATPHVDAILRLLDAKYRFRQDDVDHDDIFGWGSPP